MVRYDYKKTGVSRTGISRVPVERPILFSGPMVRAILDGRKTQTRRVMSPQPVRSLPNTKPWVGGLDNGTIHCPMGWRWKNQYWADDNGLKGRGPVVSPYGGMFQRMWVRETFGFLQYPGDHDDIVWQADRAAAHCNAARDAWSGDVFYLEAITETKWRPSIHMPRWASRLTLEITSVRVERLQDISEEDAKAEGVTLDTVPATINGKPGTFTPMTHKVAFAYLWNQINGKRAGCSWADNPWVWCISYKRLEVGNADQA